MTPYKNLWRDSGIVAYENGNDYIKVEFSPGKWTLYTYTYASAGSSVIEQMKNLAVCWEGLNEYINRKEPSYSNKC